MRYGYIKPSLIADKSSEQEQLKSLQEYGCDSIVHGTCDDIEECSEFRDILNSLKENDVLVVQKLEHISSDPEKLHNALTHLKDVGAELMLSNPTVEELNALRIAVGKEVKYPGV